jgi:pentatricopeptide repeat protein
MKFFEQNLFYLKFLGLKFEYSGYKGVFLRIYFWFMIFVLDLGTAFILSYYLTPIPMSFVELCNMVASHVSGADFFFTMITIYLKRRQFKEFMDVLDELKERGEFSGIVTQRGLPVEQVWAKKEGLRAIQILK